MSAMVASSERYTSKAPASSGTPRNSPTSRTIHGRRRIVMSPPASTGVPRARNLAAPVRAVKARGIIRRMTRRVIFLDFDGVLAPIRQWDRYGDLDPGCVRVLNEIVAGGDAEVVVSSTWRHGKTVAELQTMLDAEGFA